MRAQGRIGTLHPTTHNKTTTHRRRPRAAVDVRVRVNTGKRRCERTPHTLTFQRGCFFALSHSCLFYSPASHHPPPPHTHTTMSRKVMLLCLFGLLAVSAVAYAQVRGGEGEGPGSAPRESRAHGPRQGHVRRRFPHAAAPQGRDGSRVGVWGREVGRVSSTVVALGRRNKQNARAHSRAPGRSREKPHCGPALPRPIPPKLPPHATRDVQHSALMGRARGQGSG